MNNDLFQIWCVLEIGAKCVLYFWYFRKHLFSFLCNLFQTVSTASELRKPIYWIVAGKAIDYEQMLLLMANVKWDVKEIMSQHNIYVDALLKASTLC